MTTYLKESAESFLLGFKAPKTILPARDRPLPSWMKNTALKTENKEHMGKYRLEVDIIMDGEDIHSTADSVIHMMEILKEDKKSKISVIKIDVDDCNY